MKMRNLGRTGLRVSEICLGSMTWGRQNSEAEGHAQLDYAVAQGVNFIDTAEMYPVPRDPDYYGRTEEVIGSWLQGRGDRDKLIIATKVSGPRMTPTIRPGQVRLDRANIMAAVDASLKRLRTDYIDLYQTHWPERPSNFFGTLGVTELRDRPDMVPIEETLEALDALVKAGKVRHLGVSNETSWGLMRHLHHGERAGLARIETIQNPYSLLNRSFEIGLSEIALREEVGLLAYSPLGMGALSGKYLNGAKPEGARFTLFADFNRYQTPSGIQAIEKYVALARKYGLVPEQMAIAFTLTRPFIAATIIGATSLDQLKIDLKAAEVELGDEIMAEIEAIHREHVIPCP
ncbi:NADP(H)-dependent aldo-keto reductase [Govanella unica]|uniref:Protein tas n=1 Tax=Govanella unica TaxID=2975056 RepID=A0A9X3U0I7_9PROT|nr:NADP(H)-dependent aldo-keto reductase [Govania unica]MDA5194918.1 NADP(H)-dependent aldo-keto reductase [Govania unica]